MRLYRIVTLISLLFASMVVVAQDNISAVIEVRYEGVEISRENSDLWLPVRQGSIAFIGTGDTIRTNGTGRAEIRFDDNSHIFLLSNSDFTLTAFSTDNGAFVFGGMINGNAVVETSDSTMFDSFDLQLNDVSVTQPASLMGIWSFPDTTDAVTVAIGSAIVLNNDIEIPVPAETGFFAEPDRTEAIAFDPEWHSAGLEANLYGCKGQVKTAAQSPLLVRVGPGRGYLAMGTLDISRVVEVMGETESTGWTRIQFLTGFGWTQSLAIESDCPDLPLFPDDSPQEKFVTVINVSDEELEILEPFFESPATNVFSYEFVRN